VSSRLQTRSVTFCSHSCTIAWIFKITAIRAIEVNSWRTSQMINLRTVTYRPWSSTVQIWPPSQRNIQTISWPRLVTRKIYRTSSLRRLPPHKEPIRKDRSHQCKSINSKSIIDHEQIEKQVYVMIEISFDSFDKFNVMQTATNPSIQWNVNINSFWMTNYYLSTN